MALNIGPVITAIFASSPVFRNYGGGIIDDSLLCSKLDKSFVHHKVQTKPNHAVLVVGYGKEPQE